MMACECAFAQGSTSDNGKKQAPDRCKQAVLDRFKRVIERCDIAEKCKCPLGSFIEVKVGKVEVEA